MATEEGQAVDHTLNATESDLLALMIERLQQADDGLLTTSDLMSLMDCSRWRVTEALHKLKAEGRLIEGRKTLPRDASLGQRLSTVPAYGLATDSGSDDDTS